MGLKFFNIKPYTKATFAIDSYNFLTLLAYELMPIRKMPIRISAPANMRWGPNGSLSFQHP